MLLMRRWMVSWGFSSQTWIRAPVSSWTVCGTNWQQQMHRYITSQRFSIGFRSRERGASQWHQCLCHPGTAYTLWPHEATLSCTRRNPEPTEPAQGLTMGLRISSRYYKTVRVPLASMWRFVRLSICLPRPSLTYCQTGHA